MLLLHDPDVSGIADAITTGGAALVELRDEGVVTTIGIGTNDTAAVAKAFRETDIDIALLAGRYTLLEPAGADDVFEAASGRSIAVGMKSPAEVVENVALLGLPPAVSVWEDLAAAGLLT